MQDDAFRRYSVIVPAPSVDPKPPVLTDLETLAETLSLEVLIATGRASAISLLPRRVEIGSFFLIPIAGCRGPISTGLPSTRTGDWRLSAGRFFFLRRQRRWK